MQKAKQAIDVLVRSGDMLAPVSFSRERRLQLSVRGFAVVNVAAILLWLAVTRVVVWRRLYAACVIDPILPVR
jgi:hypothetical protein